MNPSPKINADLIQAWSGVANLALLSIIAIAGFIRFALIDSGIAKLDGEIKKREFQANTTPILALEPTLVVGPDLGKQFYAIKLHIKAKNIGKGELKLGTVSVQVSQSILPNDLAAPLSEASKREFNETFEPSIASTKVIPISRYDLPWDAIPNTQRKYDLNSLLLPNQEAQFYVDYVLEPTGNPHLIRFEVTLAPKQSSEWQAKSCDLVAPFGPLPPGFGEAVTSTNTRYMSVSAETVERRSVATESTVTDTLRLTRIE